MKIDLPGLQMLVAAIELKSLSKAAEHENLVTSAASKRIAELERQLGAVLLTRHGRGVEPTPAGIALYHRAKSILRSVELAQSAVAEFGPGGMPRIRLAVNRSAIIQYLAPALSRYFGLKPDAQVDLQERYSYDIPRLVHEGEADMGIYHALAPAPGVESVPYRRDRVGLVVPLDHPLATHTEILLEQAVEYPFVGYFPRHSFAAFLSLAERSLSHPLKVRIEVSNYEARCRMIREGIGIGIMPEQIAASYVAAHGLKTIHLRDPWAYRQFYLCTRSREELVPSVVDFLEHMLAQ
ncbi:LysR family transcriptional regulator [Burkholderia sp. SRS-W-2-2016]|uniref:LysR family transcriptional regulator n=1 Tax=Burkholderia sp. SRS-W-2-2016 TaxID=1926878 RepID=UPI00094B2B97|nr:LysR family transcriptional regulator [Burkholderia sp. SRS-W-2-2016]OLL31591.1 LysR family transcriptional regulator [Burkholderia sp. SRS-W-2-2016]